MGRLCWCLKGDYVTPWYYNNNLKDFKEKMYASNKVCLEDKSALEWSLEFWDNDDECRIWTKMEGLNDVTLNPKPLNNQMHDPFARALLHAST